MFCREKVREKKKVEGKTIYNAGHGGLPDKKGWSVMEKEVVRARRSYDFVLLKAWG